MYPIIIEPDLQPTAGHLGVIASWVAAVAFALAITLSLSLLFYYRERSRNADIPEEDRDFAVRAHVFFKVWWPAPACLIALACMFFIHEYIPDYFPDIYKLAVICLTVFAINFICTRKAFVEAWPSTWPFADDGKPCESETEPEIETDR